MPWRRCIGGGLLFLAFVLFSAIVINPMRLGGFARGGKVEDGRHFVVSKGHRYTEVPEIEWRIENYLEWCFFVPIPLVWLGLAFWVPLDVLQKKTQPLPGDASQVPKTIACLGFTGLGAWLGWVIGQVPWTAFLGAWLTFWCSVLWSLWSQTRRSSQQSHAERL